MLESVFNKVVGLHFSCEYCKIFYSSFFYKAPPPSASKKFINFQENISGRSVIDLSFQ